MPRVITEACIGVKDASCVQVCPVDCIHPRPDEADYANVDHLYINPDDCIDCGACEPACPVSAIFPLEDVPDNMKSYIEKNASYYKK
ncbi:MAG: ferredoxin family protein [Spirochaetia bacterium]|nr:ferredoxin family protein [Spirochaetota bacterium]MCX8097235.1 ferredoxin family protein [Spirochaetota bacterium]MDW8111989.1 ferredoxin family protein [Spirochaetia bacterium]